MTRREYRLLELSCRRFGLLPVFVDLGIWNMYILQVLSHIHSLTRCAAVRFRAPDAGSGQPGIGVDQFISTAVGRLCD